MKALVITDNLRKANFVQAGFQYENIFVDVLEYKRVSDHFFSDDLNLLPFKFVVFHFSEFDLSERLLALMDILFSQAQHNLSYALCDVFIDKPGYFSKFKRVFFRAYNYRQISSLIRIDIFAVDSSQERQVIECGPLIVDLEAHLVKIDGTAVFLSNKEFALLYYLVLNRGKVMSRAQILENVWDHNASIDTNTVDVHVSKLRKILKSYNLFGISIKTVHATGYIFL